VTSIELQLTDADYRRATAFVIAHLRALGRMPTSLRPLSVMAATLYGAALFVIAEAPNYSDDRTRLLIRGSVLALMAVPFLFAIGVKRLRLADAKAMQPLEPQSSESVHVSISASGVEVQTGSMATQLQWSAVSIFVLDPQFAVFLAPRMAPLPIVPSASATQEAFLLFLSHAQQYKANSAA
jgi:hypothetical protein